MAHTPPGETRRNIYHFVRERIWAGFPPTVREVQEAFGFRSVQSARAQLQLLVEEGLLQQVEGIARGYRLSQASGMSPGGSVLIPLLGRVQAGALTTAVEEIEGYLPVRSRYPAAELFALRIRGESMLDAGILPGDLIVVRQQSLANAGDIVVALVDDEATVKYWQPHGEGKRARVTLQPANNAFAPLTLSRAAVQLLGRVIELRRSFDELLYLEG